MNVFGRVKTSINTREAAARYGVEVNRNELSARSTMTAIQACLWTITTTIALLAASMGT